MDPKQALQKIDKYFKMKEGTVAPPDLHLGGKIKPVRLENGRLCWGQSASMYVQDAVRNIEDWAEQNGLKLPGKCDAPMSTSCRPELDVHCGALIKTLFTMDCGLEGTELRLREVKLYLESSHNIV